MIRDAMEKFSEMVAQIARSLAHSLNVNEDLAETIALLAEAGAE